MGLARRRRALGYSQEELAQLLGVDRTTVGRWETGRIAPQPAQRRVLAAALDIGLHELDVLLDPLSAAGEGGADRRTGSSPGPLSAGDPDDMIRREFLRVLTISGALAALPVEEVEALTDGVRRSNPADFTRMNGHLWQVYRLARSKGSVSPVVRDQLTALSEALDGPGSEARSLLGAAADLFQLAGEVAFDANRYADAAASYTLAASVSREVDAYDLWACALVRHAYVEISEHRYGQAAQMLGVAERLAGRGDGALSTRHWVASVQAEAYAGLGDLGACERALDRAEEVRELPSDGGSRGWLRFDGSRLVEERGARYVRLGRLNLAEATLNEALHHMDLASGQSLRRRGAVLTDLAAVGVKRRDPEQAVVYGREAAVLARASSSGYLARRLRSLSDEFGPLARDHRVAELGAEIAALQGAP
ncbi:helix-turn-helix transcriptional regulator [Streptomyces sp. NPDC005805]|uniref:helix-turn-helix transcriptional regulator n=1 Tax=Streptomyces sp. NPDC005805 TaxID=3157068 RepID=UPI0033E33BA6